MTLAQSRGIKGPPEPEGKREAAHGQAHPGPLEYVQIGAILVVVTAVEVAIYYIDALSDVLVPILIVLSAAKFSLVVLWFMHLKFDARLFSWMFVGGIALASSLFVVVLATLGSGLT
jgi:cytochrome c oxidase subunit 4